MLAAAVPRSLNGLGETQIIQIIGFRDHDNTVVGPHRTQDGLSSYIAST